MATIMLCSCTASDFNPDALQKNLLESVHHPVETESVAELLKCDFKY